MDRAEAIVKERRRLAAAYDNAFEDLKWLQTPKTPVDFYHGYQSFACLVAPERVKSAIAQRKPDEIKEIYKVRNNFMSQLERAGISTRPATHAIHLLSYYRDKYGISALQFPNSLAANDCSISFPLFHGMTDEEQSSVINQAKELSF